MIICAVQYYVIQKTYLTLLLNMVKCVPPPHFSSWGFESSPSFAARRPLTLPVAVQNTRQPEREAPPPQKNPPKQIEIMLPDESRRLQIIRRYSRGAVEGFFFPVRFTPQVYAPQTSKPHTCSTSTCISIQIEASWLSEYIKLHASHIAWSYQ